MTGVSRGDGVSRWPLYIIILVMVIVVMSAQAPWLLLSLLGVISISTLLILAYYIYASRTPYTRFFGRVLVEDDPREIFEPRDMGVRARKVRKRP